MRHADGHWVYILGQGRVSQRDESGRPVRFTGNHLDITLQKKQEAEITKAKEKAEQAEKFKSEFLANMSHEIRSPMNGVLGMVDLLADTKLDKEQKMMLDTIRSSGETLMALLNDILDLSKIESTRLQLEKTTFNLHEIITTIMGPFNPIASKKGVKLKYSGNLNKRSYYIGDALRIKQVLTNLISNGVKFTDQGEVNLSVTEHPKDKQKSHFEIVIKDTGIGIKEEAKAKIFSAFTQADSSITRRYGGTGLGLVICKYLIELMDGEIYFESQEGVGTTFFIKLDLEKIQATAKSFTKAGDNKNFSKHYPHQILLVEDNLVNQQVATMFLKKLGYQCDVAQNGKDALAKLSSHPIGYYSLILKDLQMPVMDGLKAIKHILEKYGDKSPTVVAMTANAFRSDLDSCMKLGMKDFLTKPVSLQKLKEVLKRFTNIPEHEPRDKILSMQAAKTA